MYNIDIYTQINGKQVYIKTIEHTPMSFQAAVKKAGSINVGLGHKMGEPPTPKEHDLYVIVTKA